MSTSKCFFVTGPDGVPWLIFEFMPYGDLLTVLKSNCGDPNAHKSNLPKLVEVRICSLHKYFFYCP